MTRDDPPGGSHTPEEDRSVALLVLWAEMVADFACLPPRHRARVLPRVEDDIRQALAAAPDKELIYPWQIRQVNQAYGFEVIPAPPRVWRFAPEPGVMRVIGK